MLFRASHHTGPLEIELTRRNIPFVKFGGLKFLDAAHVKDVLALPALRREPARPRRRLPRAAAPARHRPGDGGASPRPRRGGRRRRRRRSPAFAPPARGRGRLAGLRRALCASCAARVAAGRPRSSGCARWYEPHLERIHDDAAIRAARPRPARADRRRLSLARALPDRAHPRPAGRDQRRGRRAAPRRGLSDPLDHPFGQGPGMDARSSCSTASTAASPPTSAPAPARRSRRSAGCSTSR